MTDFFIGPDYPERVYAGWLGKIIGVRLGAPIEGMTYDAIKARYGHADGYIIDVRGFAADDDTNCPMVFLQTLEDYGLDAGPYEFGLNWLNYAPYEHGFFWWGGYGISTEHTAYQNLYNGIMAPQSGSAKLNGLATAEQIGGQIFVDPFGFIAPGNPEVAAHFAECSSKVSHDGNGLYGARFVAACIALAFTETDIHTLVEKALCEMPVDSEYYKMARDVISFYKNGANTWVDCYRFVEANYGYDRYPGTCHIIPNSAIIILSLLYGGGEFDKTLVICNLCGWDTDCNAGNVGAIMGVFCGLDGIDHKKWIEPLHDYYVSSSVVGSRNIYDIPSTVWRTAKLGYALAGLDIPERVTDGLKAFTFELPVSTHGFAAKGKDGIEVDHVLENSEETAFSGERSLKISSDRLKSGEISVFYKPYYEPHDFKDNRYEPELSPTLYPGQSLECMVKAPISGISAQLYVNDRNGEGDILFGESIKLEKGEWVNIAAKIPRIEGGCLREAGVRFFLNEMDENSEFTVFIDDFKSYGAPDYSINFKKGGTEKWSWCQTAINTFTRFKGSWRIEGDKLVGSCTDRGEVYTGSHHFEDYSVSAVLAPVMGENHRLLVRVQGAIRSYGVSLRPNGKIALEKNENGYRELASEDLGWEFGQKYKIAVSCNKNQITVYADDKKVIAYTDFESPYMSGQIGFGVSDNACCAFSDVSINNI